MTGPGRPVRQPPNTRASILRTGFLRLAAFPWMPETRTFISARGSSGRSVVHTPRRRETGRPRAAQFAPRAVYIPGGGTTWCGKEGAQDGDSRSALTGAGRRWRGVPGAGRAAPAGAAGALLPDARLLRRRRGRRPGDAAGRLAG